MGRYEAHTVIALDFDGTIKKTKEYNHNFQDWELSPGFKRFYHWAVKNEVVLSLWTCRNMEDPVESSVVEAFLDTHDLKYINTDYKPGATWKTLNHSGQYWSTGSAKMYADLYVDDLACGCPLTCFGHVNWRRIKREVKSLLKKK